MASLRSRLAAFVLLEPGAEARLDRIQAAGDLDHRGRVVRRIGEVLAETLGIQRGGGDDELQVAAASAAVA
jgi:hypothetical protein